MHVEQLTELIHLGAKLASVICEVTFWNQKIMLNKRIVCVQIFIGHLFITSMGILLSTEFCQLILHAKSRNDDRGFLQFVVFLPNHGRILSPKKIGKNESRTSTLGTLFLLNLEEIWRNKPKLDGIWNKQTTLTETVNNCLKGYKWKIGFSGFF